MSSAGFTTIQYPGSQSKSLCERGQALVIRTPLHRGLPPGLPKESEAARRFFAARGAGARPWRSGLLDARRGSSFRGLAPAKVRDGARGPRIRMVICPVWAENSTTR